MKTNVREANGKPKAEANYLVIRASEARKHAQVARKHARQAKARLKAARKVFKQARKVAKKARKEAKILAKALKAQAKPLRKPAIKRSLAPSPTKSKPQRNRVAAPHIVIENPTPPIALTQTASSAEPPAGR